jgi:hypothetical protein
MDQGTVSDLIPPYLQLSLDFSKPVLYYTLYFPFASKE